MFQFLSDSSPLFVSRRFSKVVWIAAAAAVLLSGCASYGPPKVVPEAVLSLSASSFNFKTVVIGQTQNQTLHVSNTGTAPLNITKLGVSNPQFVVSGPSVPRVVLPSMEIDYTVTFTPTTAGNETASLTIQSNATTSTASVSLAGIAEKVIATVEVSPSSLNFGNLNLQTTSTKNVTVQNTGDINITISGVTVVGSGFGYSDLSPGFSLAPNQSVTFQVWFRPQVKGAASGTVDILSANLSAPATLALAGDGVSPTTTPPPPPPPPASSGSAHCASDMESQRQLNCGVSRVSLGIFGQRLSKHYRLAGFRDRLRRCNGDLRNDLLLRNHGGKRGGPGESLFEPGYRSCP